MLIRRALALSSLALATAVAADNIASSPLLTAHDAAGAAVRVNTKIRIQ